jgi:hypothetical protein
MADNGYYVNELFVVTKPGVKSGIVGSILSMVLLWVIGFPIKANAELFNLIEQIKTFGTQYRDNLSLYELMHFEHAVQCLNYALDSAKQRPEIMGEL